MRKSKVRSSQSLRTTKSAQMKEENLYVPPLDVLVVKIVSLQLADEDLRYYAIKVTFLDQLLLSSMIKPSNMREEIKKNVIAKAIMNYDPSDYEKMCSFADNPLIVNIQPLRNFQTSLSGCGQSNTPFNESPIRTSSPESYAVHGYPGNRLEISCANVDILPMFIDTDEMCVKKRMEPLTSPPILYRKSWDNLPLLTMKLKVVRNKENAHHHEVLKNANHMKFSLVGAYNLIIPYEESSVYMAATKLPVHNETNSSLMLFDRGHRATKRFKSTSLYPKWESLRIGEDVFTKGDQKLVCRLKDLERDSDINVGHFLSETSRPYTAVWGSFHRTLLLGNAEKSLKHNLRRWHWPLELHIFRDQAGSLAFMALIDLFKLLYPGESSVRMAVPLLWLNSQVMSEQCGCDLLLTADRIPTPHSFVQKVSKATTESALSTTTDSGVRTTGAEEGNAFVIIEVRLARPLVQLVITPPIPIPEINEMLEEMETGILKKRECTGRGQLPRDWQSTVRSAANSLRRVPHYGMTEFCMFNRQLSETRIRVELFTSCWMDSAIFVNNNFVVQDFLKSNEMFEELLMMSHACLMKITCDTLLGIDDWNDLDPTLRAARHARQMQDIPHASELFMLLASEKPYNGNHWRELGTCLKDVDRDWANVCYDRALMLNIRDPLTLLAKGCMVFEEDPDEAEPFFLALLAMYPFWSTAWIATNAYFISRELYRMAEQVAECLRLTQTGKMIRDLDYPRSWEHELGDWWETTPLLPGMNPYFDAADLLLRIRALNLAEVCIAGALTDSGLSAAYYHFVALCCRLQDRYNDALCHLQQGIERFGEISYLRSLEAECHHKNQDINAAMASFEKAGSVLSGYSILLSLPSREPPRVRSMVVDLLRRQPSAYAWMALAEDWLLRAAVGEGGDAGLTEEQSSAMKCANACAIQALRCDRRAGRAWAHLAVAVKPSARRLHCRKMAAACGHALPEDRKETNDISRQSLCHRLGIAQRDCNCHLCVHLSI